MQELYSQYEQAWQQYVAATREDPAVIGILIAGSFVQGQLDPHSDLDVYVILRPDCDYRERGNTWINGVEIEYFKNPPRQIRRYFKVEQNSPNTAHMLAQGRVVYQTSPLVNELIAEAKAYIQQGPIPMNADQIATAQYALDDFRKDWEDSRAREDGLGAHLIRAQLVNFCIEVFCRQEGVWRMKFKRMQAQLGQLDPGFLDAIQQTLSVSALSPAALNPLLTYMAGSLGGNRPSEWVLRTALS